MVSRISALFSALLLATLFCSCASVSVKETRKLSQQRLKQAPEKIFIRPFEFYDEGVRVDREGENLRTFKYELQEMMTRNLAKRLPEYVGPVKAVAANAPLPRGNYWVVTGRFNRVNQGSRIMRMFLGLGAGGTKLETSVIVYDLSGEHWRPLLRVETTGGSNISPGTLGTAGYFVSGVMALGSVANVVDGFRSGVTFDTVRTSREVTAAMSEYLYLEDVKARNEAIAPKRLGKAPNAVWPFKVRPAKKKEGSVEVVPVAQ